MPVWAKLTPATTDIVVEAGAVFRGGADAVSSSNTFPSLPLIDPETLEFEMNVDGLRLERRPGRSGHPAAVAGEDGADDAARSPTQAFSGIGGIAEFGARAELLPPRLRHRAGVHGGDARPRRRPERDQAPDRRAWRSSMERNGWTSLDDFRGLRRDRVVVHSQIRRPDAEAYHGGYEAEAGQRLNRVRAAAEPDFVELTDDLSASPLWNPDLAPTPARAPHLVHLSHRRAVDRHERGHHHLHARLRADAAGHDVVAGDDHHPARQRHRAGAR